MRLIDANAIKFEHIGFLSDKGVKILINEQPTAYDVDKTIEEIRKYADNVAELGGNFLPRVVIEIVKEGGEFKGGESPFIE